MKNNKKNFRPAIFIRIISFAGALLMSVLCMSFSSKAADLDEILNYVITVDVNDDATLHMVYHIDWKVLDSTSDGPLSWVIIGTPNKHYSNLNALSSNIKEIRYTTDNGSGARITLDRDYYKDEVISFDFELTQDYMYQMNLLTDGETVYQFIPGWFDEINVDNLVIRWNADNVISVSPSATLEDGYYVWEAKLPKGARYKVDITYDNGAYNFSKDKEIAPQKTKFQMFWDEYGPAIIVVAVIVGGVAFILIIKTIVDLIGWVNSSGFKATEKKIRRTVIEYYPNCPGCGAPRPEGKENCEYCGMNFVKSEKIVEETKVPKQFKDIKDEIFGFRDNGTYRVSSTPNTYVRVSTIVVPHRTSFLSYVSEQDAARAARSGGGHSGCAHSSCACACACACAGGGRAGCTAKDFYKTDLKMKYFKKR